MPSNILELNPDEVTLKVGGAIYRNWKEISIKRSLDSISGSFDLSVTGIATDSKVIVPLAAGDECQVALGSDPIITGYIDSISKTLDSTQKSISISGRDRTGQLVDCSAIRKMPWQEVSFEKIAHDLLEPFSITLEVKSPTGGPFKVWSVNQGESVFECLSRAARMRGLMLLTDGKGALVVTKAETKLAQASLKEGINLLSMSSTSDVKSRFKTYQVESRLSPELGYQLSTGFLVQGVAHDPDVKLNRTLALSADGLPDKSAANVRADWEMKTRRAKSHKVTVVVQGFRSSLGKVWTIGDSVKVESTFLGFDHSLLITGVQFQLNTQGRRTTLELESIDGITPDPTLKATQNPYLKLLKGGI